MGRRNGASRDLATAAAHPGAEGDAVIGAASAVGPPPAAAAVAPPHEAADPALPAAADPAPPAADDAGKAMAFAAPPAAVDAAKAMAVAAPPAASDSGKAAAPDLGRALTPATSPLTEEEKNLQRSAQTFVDKFYATFNTDRKAIHLLYEDQCSLYWTVHLAELSCCTKTATGIFNFWANSNEEITCHPYCFQAEKKDDITLIVVNGLCEWTGLKGSNFVEAFLLNETLEIVKDIMFVFEDGRPIRLPKCSAPAKKLQQQALTAIPDGQSSQRRRSTRILEKLTKKHEALTIRTDAERMKKAVTQKRIDKKPEALTIRTDFILKRSEKEPAELPMTAASRESISVALLYDDIMLGHKSVFYCTKADIRMVDRKKKNTHVEKPERISCIIERLKEENLFDRVTHVRHEFAAVDDILAVHCAEYVAFVQRLPLSPEEIKDFTGFYTDDMYCSEGTRDAVFSAAGANIKACELVYKDQFKSAFAVVRPPGHHVGTDEAEGFCYANNIAIGASFLLRNHGVKKILVVDWDVHHGNGTQKLFYESNEVLFFNIYNMNLPYPNTSKQGVECVGKGKGAGFNFNVPLTSGFGDSDVLYVWNNLLIPLAKQFDPEITLISCGFDAAEGDEVGHCKVTAPCYATMLDMLMKAGNGKVVLTLEGGYELPVLAKCASYCVRALVGDHTALRNDKEELHPILPPTRVTLNRLKRYHSRFWDPFKRDPKG